MAGKLDGKVAIVTGASSGIGEATALALAGEGAKVALVARRKDRLEDLADRIGLAGGVALPLEADLRDEAQVQSMVRRTDEAWGCVDILVNNAGLMLLGPILGADLEDWRRMMDVNVMALMVATHAAVPVMREQGGGHIVQVSSVAGRTARAGYAVYNATKWAVGAFSEALRQEVAKFHIRVTVVEPGAVATELREHITVPEVKEQQQAYVASITPLSSEDIASAILWAVTQPPHVNVNEILIRPTEQDR